MGAFYSGDETMSTLLGYEIYENPNLVEYTTVDRTWRERLLSMPWRPWVRVKTVASPMKDLIRTNGKLFGHPETIAKLRDAIAETKP
jgi:hypothetical protein